jgi:hypothetical protein
MPGIPRHGNPNASTRRSAPGLFMRLVQAEHVTALDAEHWIAR